MADEILSSDWIKKALEHEQYARLILAHHETPAWGAGFFSQQVAELLLKGLLLVHDLKVVKTHDLLELKKILLQYEPGIESHTSDLNILNEYYIENRYPGDYPDVSWQDAEKALAAAERIKEFVLSKIT